MTSWELLLPSPSPPAPPCIQAMLRNVSRDPVAIETKETSKRTGKDQSRKWELLFRAEQNGLLRLRKEGN